MSMWRQQGQQDETKKPGADSTVLDDFLEASNGFLNNDVPVGVSMTKVGREICGFAQQLFALLPEVQQQQYDDELNAGMQNGSSN